MKRRLKRLGKWIVRMVALAAVLAVVAGGYFYDYPRVAADLPEAVLAYRDASLPWTARDVAPNPPVRDEENAAPGLRAALDAWPHRLAEGTATYEDPIGSAALYGEPVAPLLPRLAPALRLAHEAVRRPRLDLGRDWDQGQSLRAPEYAGFKALARGFAARAETRAAAGDDAGAVGDLEDARRLGRLVASEPSVIAAFVGASCEAFALESAQACLVRAAAEPARLARYRELLAQPAPLPDLNRALRGELYAIIATVRNLDRDDRGGHFPDALRLKDGDVPDLAAAPGPLRRDGLPTDLRDRAYLARCLRRWTELAEATHGLTDPVDRIGHSAESIESEHQGTPTAVSFYEGVLFPTYANLGRTNHRTTARRALALAFADALIGHARTGAWPSFVPVPDPLGEGTFGTRVDHDGRFRVWSVGDNGVDDGGLARSERVTSTQRADDLVAAYPPLPVRHSKRPPPSLKGLRM